MASSSVTWRMIYDFPFGSNHIYADSWQDDEHTHTHTPWISPVLKHLYIIRFTTCIRLSHDYQSIMRCIYLLLLLSLDPMISNKNQITRLATTTDLSSRCCIKQMAVIISKLRTWNIYFYRCNGSYHVTKAPLKFTLNLIKFNFQFNFLPSQNYVSNISFSAHWPLIQSATITIASTKNEWNWRMSEK